MLAQGSTAVRAGPERSSQRRRPLFVVVTDIERV